MTSQVTSDPSSSSANPKKSALGEQPSYRVDRLIGSIEENFYNLGLQDKVAFWELLEHLEKLSKTDKFSAIVRASFKFLNLGKKRNPYFERIVSAYCEGVGCKEDKFYQLLYLPEIISSQSKWIPSFLSMLPGCSSLFVWDEKKEAVIHSRILDFPLVGQYDKNERAMLYDLTGLPKIFSHSTQGIPLPGLTAMNEHGLTLAVHQKFSDVFNKNGTTIVEIAFELLTKCENVVQAKKLLRSQESLTYWGLFLSDSTGDVLAADICGNKVYAEIFSLKESKTLYFNNIPLFKDDYNYLVGPSCYLDTCQMKVKNLEQSLKSVAKSEDKDIWALQVLSENTNGEGDGDWSQQCITPSSVQAITFNSSDKTSTLISGLAPKRIEQGLQRIENMFNASEVKVTHLELADVNQVDQKEDYLKDIAFAQRNYDLGEYERAYHHLQMALISLKGTQEYWVYQFFFDVWQFINCNVEEDFRVLFRQFHKFEGKLPSFLDDHLKLFIMRFEKILKMSHTVKANDLKNEQLREIFEQEMKLKPIVLKNMRHLIYPRLELPDIIYMY